MALLFLKTLTHIIAPRLTDAEGPLLALQADALAKVQADRLCELRACTRKVA